MRNRRLAGLKFNRQYLIEYQKGSFFIVDFYCHEKELVVELDGRIHDFQIEKDQNRDQILRDLGFQIVRLSNEEVLEGWSSVAFQLISILRN